MVRLAGHVEHDSAFVLRAQHGPDLTNEHCIFRWLVNNVALSSQVNCVADCAFTRVPTSDFPPGQRDAVLIYGALVLRNRLSTTTEPGVRGVSQCYSWVVTVN